MNRRTFFSMILFIVSSLAFALDKVSVEISPLQTDVSAGQTIELKFAFKIPQKYHIYSFGDVEIGQPTQIKLTLPQGYKLQKMSYPPTSKFTSFGFTSDGYSNDFAVEATILAPAKIEKNGVDKIMATVSWLACAEQCVPGEISKTILLNQKSGVFAQASTSDNSLASNMTANAKVNFGEILAVLASAFLGGMILNLMPCVFPVIGLKIISFATGAGKSRKEAVVGALFYTLGILATFLGLAVLLLILRAAGQNLGWGFQLQNPVFTGLMALLFFGMALSFAGVFEIGAGFAGGGTLGDDSASKSKKYWSAIFSGVVAVLVASPCTAPFMGAAMGAALATDASNILCLSIFASIGLGMAAPYVVLSAIPSLARAMPRPGAWMDYLKQLLAIPLFASVIWLVWVYAKQTQSLTYILGALLLLSVGARIFGMFYMPHFSLKTRIVAILCFFAAIATSIYMTFDGTQITPSISTPSDDESAWTVQRQNKLLSEGKIVYVDFTASWCLTCQYNKQILHSDSVKEIFKKHNVAVLIGDWTNKDPKITAELEKFGRAGVPLNLVYAPKKQVPVVLPAILTPSAVIDAIDKSAQ